MPGQPTRRLIFEGLRAVARAGASSRPAALARLFAPDVIWRGCHPLGEVEGLAALDETFWQPLSAAFPDLERRDHIFIGGTFEGERWISATGYYFGTFAGNFLGIPAHGGWAQLRFGEFYRLDGDRIAEAFVALDLVDLMRQAGVRPWTHGAGIETCIPAPAHGRGVRLAEGSPAATRKTDDLVMRMLGALFEPDRAAMGMERFWSRDMMWYGPAMIGTTRGLDGFFERHQLPWMRAFPDWQDALAAPHFADGDFACYGGWPSIRATQSGAFLGLAPTGRTVDIRVMDWWRREGALLVENWIFIDFPHLFLQFGIDLFERMRALVPVARTARRRGIA